MLLNHLCEAQFDASLFERFGKLLQFFQITGFFLWWYWHVFGHLQVGHVHVVLHRRSCQTRATHSLNQRKNLQFPGVYDFYCPFSTTKHLPDQMFRFWLSAGFQSFWSLLTKVTTEFTNTDEVFALLAYLSLCSLICVEQVQQSWWIKTEPKQWVKRGYKAPRRTAISLTIHCTSSQAIHSSYIL